MTLESESEKLTCSKRCQWRLKGGRGCTSEDEASLGQPHLDLLMKNTMGFRPEQWFIFGCCGMAMVSFSHFFAHGKHYGVDY